MTIKRKGPKRIKITSVDSYHDVVNDMLTDFLDTFHQKEGLTREPTQEDLEDFCGEEISWIYTQKGMRLYNTACRRYSELGEKVFGEKVECYSSGMLMP